MEERQWATLAAEALARGETVTVRARGHSMRGRIEHGSSVTLEPCRAESVTVGDIVLARVRGWLLVLHQVLRVEPGRFEIGTTAGRSDGWVTAEDVLGRVISVEQ